METANNVVLSAKEVSFSYQKGKEVLSDISVDFDERSTAIIGQNGAGKTTFMKLIKGLLLPTKGMLSYKGENCKNLTVAQLAKEIGMVYQNPNDQIFKNTVLEEVMFGPLQIGIDKEMAKEKAMMALKRMELEHVAKENPYDLLLSERKLISIASILAMDTKIVIFDEPTIAQDLHGKQLIQKTIFELKKEGKIVLSILHDMDFVTETFERILVFSKGKMLFDGMPSEVFAKEDILKEACLEQPGCLRISKELELDYPCYNFEELISCLSYKEK